MTPDLTKASAVAIDVETKDLNLKKKGPGGVRGDGHVVGFSVAADGFCEYYPIAHPEGNVSNPEQVIAWLKDLMASGVPKVGANILYDMEWLKADLGIDLRGNLIDVQVAESLIDENKNVYSLDSLAQKYLNVGKNDATLRAECCRLFGFKEEKLKDETVKGLIWNMPASSVYEYGVADADLPLRVWEKQKKIISEEELTDAFRLECELLPVLLDMRFRGVRVDIDRAQEVRAILQDEYDGTLREIKNRCGQYVNIYSNASIAKAMDSLGIEYPRTVKGAPSFVQSWLMGHEHPVCQLITSARKFQKAISTFIDNGILSLHHNGRVHPSVKSTKGDDGGTRTGRLAYALPNLQQVPARDPYLTPLIRSIFLPEDGCRWGLFDYSQQEPRITVHYAYILGLGGSAEARKSYTYNDDTDYHQMVADMAQISRKAAKSINLGLAYGMGKNKLAHQMGVPFNEAESLLQKYHAAIPYVKALSDRCMNAANHRGYVKTHLKRRRRFDLFEPVRNWDREHKPLPLEQALEGYKGMALKRYGTYRAMNAVIQGTAAEMNKRAMVEVYKEGFRIIVCVHDENDVSITSEDDCKRIIHIMKESMPLSVPMKIDCELGDRWSTCEEVQIDS